MPELGVSMAVFVIILVILVGVERLDHDSRGRESEHQQNFRAALLGLEHVKQELYKARFYDVDGTGKWLEYRKMLLDENTGKPRWGPSGEFFWSAPYHLEVRPGGNLVRIYGLDERKLVALGLYGTVNFALTPERFDEITVTIYAQPGDPSVRDIKESVLIRFENY